MKTTIYTIGMVGILLMPSLKSQMNVSTFENFTLAPNSFYKDTNSTPFQDVALKFRHEQSKYGNTWYWTGGFSYTNKYDSSTAGSSNLYGVRPYLGYNNSSKYCIGQMNARIILKSPYNQLDGFYVTNTTYAFKSMKYGDAFAKKFGGPTGNDPDFFKITVRAYKNGTLKTDSVEFYLADYRFNNNSMDYIIQTWQWVNTSSLGTADSVEIRMFSSDNGPYGMNTPAFFGIDNVTASVATGLTDIFPPTLPIHIFPNPASDYLLIASEQLKDEEITEVNLISITGETTRCWKKTKVLPLESVLSGVYVIQIKTLNAGPFHQTVIIRH